MQHSTKVENNNGGVINRNLRLSLILNMLTNIIGIVVVSLLLSIAIEWIGMFSGYWKLPGAQHSLYALQNELRWTGYAKYWLDPIPIIKGTEQIVLDVFTSNILALNEYLMSAYNVTQITLLRVIIIICSVPASITIWLLALIDGLSSRDLRRYRVLHESSFIYHNAKSLLGTFMILPPFIYLSFPGNFHPTLFLLLFTFPSALIIWLMSSRFKKYA